MPFKKRNKQQQKKCQNKIMKKRLMQISICVDNYIYKHKPITIDEAKTYAQEIALYKTQCSGDIHILQVIDKLTRCMKSIIEEATKNLIQSNITNGKEENIDVKYCNNIHLEDKSNAKNKKINEMITPKNITYQNIETTQAIFAGCESINKTIDGNDVPLNKTNQNYDLNKLNLKRPDDNIELENKNPETIDKSKRLNFKSNIVDRIVKSKITTTNDLDEDNSKITNTEKPPLKNFETPMLMVKDHLISGYKHVSNTQQLNIDQAKTNVNVITEPIQDRDDLSYECLQTPKCILKATIKLEKNQQTHTTSLNNIGTENNKKKNNRKVTQRANFSVNNAKKEINKSVKLASEKKKKCVTKKSSNKENILNTTQERKNPEMIPGNKTNKSKIPKKIKHTNVYIRNDEVSVTAQDENRSDQIVSHVDSLRYNKCVENELSWIENIRYVREVSPNEFDPKLNGLEENFWNNFSMPGGWTDIDFY